MRSMSRLFVFVSVLLLVAQVCLAQQLTLTPLKATGIYAVGEKVGWEVRVRDPNAAPVREATYTLKRNGLTTYKEGTLDLASGKASIRTSLDAPGAVLLEIRVTGATDTPAGGRGRGFGRGRTLAGAMVAPEKLEPSLPRPADFDTWWEAKIKQLNAIPANPQIEPNESGKPNVEYFTVRMDNINGTHIYGQLAKPKGEGKCPSLISMGFIDETCPPTGVWSAVNQIKVPKEVLPLINSPHNDMPPGVQRPHQVRREEWLAALAKGENPIK